MSIFNVSFFHPVTKMLYARASVEVGHAADAVKAAIEKIGETSHASFSAPLASLDAAITNEVGEGVVGLEKAMSKAQIQAQLDHLIAQLKNLDDDGQTAAQKQAASTTVPDLNQTVTAPAPQNPVTTNPTLYTPSGNTPVPQEVTPGPAQQVNAGTFTQADVDAQIAAALAKAQVSPAMQG